MNLYVASNDSFLTYHLVLDGCFKFKLGTYGTYVNCKQWLDKIQSSCHLQRLKGKVDIVVEYSDTEQIISLIANTSKIADVKTYRIKIDPFMHHRCYVIIYGLNTWAVELPYTEDYLNKKLSKLLNKEIQVDNELQMIYDILQVVK